MSSVSTSSLVLKIRHALNKAMPVAPRMTDVPFILKGAYLRMITMWEPAS